jgi:CubicO group peptidase (beta-lactamase class C family)
MLATWFESELNDKRKILQAFWDKKIATPDRDFAAINKFEDNLKKFHFPQDPTYDEKIEMLFNNAIAGKINFEQFFATLQHRSLPNFSALNTEAKLIQFPPAEEKLDLKVNAEDIAKIRQYMSDTNISAVIALGNAKKQELTVIASGGNKTSDIFGLFSVSKILTGILVFKMLSGDKKVLQEKDLTTKGIKLDTKVMEALPKIIQERLKEVTLHQLMTHMAGIGDYAENANAEIQRRIDTGEPQIRSMGDLLRLIEYMLYPIDQTHYSNAGILLLGFALEHAYNTKHSGEPPLSYNDILKKYLLDVIGMDNFSFAMPKSTEEHQVKYNLMDNIAPHWIGNPAGGNWITVTDLVKFGQWLYDEYAKNPAFKDFLATYGREFYSANNQVIGHGGASRSSSSDFMVSLKTGTIIATLSNQPDAAAQSLQRITTSTSARHAIRQFFRHIY